MKKFNAGMNIKDSDVMDEINELEKEVYNERGNNGLLTFFLLVNDKALLSY